MSAPVSIWTTCLKEAVSAWTKVVGNGVVSMVRGTGLGDGGSGWCGRGDAEAAAEDGEEEEVEEDGELGSCGAMGRSCLGGAATSIVGLFRGGRIGFSGGGRGEGVGIRRGRREEAVMRIVGVED
jgi:hypothetical protein